MSAVAVGRWLAGAFSAVMIAAAPAGAAEHEEPPADSPAFDPAPAHAGVLDDEESDADDLGVGALAAIGGLLVVAVAMRAVGRGDSDKCPLCKSTLSISAGESRCGRCGFRVVRTRTRDAFFGSAAPRTGVTAAGPPGGGASGSW